MTASLKETDGDDNKDHKDSNGHHDNEVAGMISQVFGLAGMISGMISGRAGPASFS